jgi:TolA-binding protein
MFNTRRLLPLAFLAVTLPAHAVSKDMVQLQTQIQQLQDAVARLQQSNDERMGVLKDLVQQTADSVNRMSVAVNGLQQKLNAQAEASGAKSDQLSGQIQSLNDSIDELKARMARLDKAMGNVESQQQSANALLQGLQPAATAPQGPPATTLPPQTQNVLPTQPAPAVKNLPSAAPHAPAADMYRAAYSDYMSARYALASSEFTELTRAYPDDNLSGNAFFYLGEIDSRSARPTSAVHNYDHVLEHFPDNSKIPAAHLHKAEAMLSMKQNDGGIRELRTLIQRFPNSPEAAQARTRLASVTAGKAR